MEAADALGPAPGRAGRRIARVFHGRPRLTVSGLLVVPVGCLVVGYLGSLAQQIAAALHSPSDIRRTGAHSRLAAGGLGGPRSRPGDHVPEGRPAPGAAGGDRGLDFYVLAHAGRLHHTPTGVQQPVHRQRRLLEHQQQPAARVRVRHCPGADHGHLSDNRSPTGGVRAPMRFSRRSKIALRVAVSLTLAFIYVPLVVIGIYAFNSSNILSWPPPGLTTHWFSQAFDDGSVGHALVTSVEEGLVAT